MIIRCAICSHEITTDGRFVLVDCDHSPPRVVHEDCIDSWAEDNEIEAAAPAIERSK